jgi:hypothetical protein
MELPHFDRATRRAFLRQGLAATGAAGAAGVVLAACSKSDAVARRPSNFPADDPRFGSTLVSAALDAEHAHDLSSGIGELSVRDPVGRRWADITRRAARS